MFGKLKGKKTYVTGVTAIIGFIAAHLIGEMTLAEMAQGSLTAILGMTIRHGVSTESGKSE